jgi:lipopolysaccharide biosynthesis protein
MRDSLPRALIMAHYDPHGLVDPHVLFSLAAYRGVFSRIVFVSVSVDRLPKGHEHLADVVIGRENIGYDFFSWKVGFHSLPDKQQFFEIVFANDSIYGPLFDIGHTLLAERVKDADLWGVVTSFERYWHIQSFFFAMRHRLLASPVARAFWDGIDPLRDKGDVINRYELPMASFFRSHGWTTATIYNPPVSQAKNPMHFVWSSAISAGVPFVKIELLRNNPFRLSAEPIRAFINHKTRYPLALIDAHVERTKSVWREENVVS